MNEPIKPKLNVLIFGAGAIGTYIGGSLAYTGNNVVFIERGEVIKKLKEQGLYLNLPETKIHFENPAIANSISEAMATTKYDIAIVAIKSYHTDALIKSLEPFVTELPPFLCFQNGVENEAKFEELLGGNKVIAGTVTSAIGRKNIGSVILEKFRGVGIANTHPLSPVLAHAFNEANLNAQLYDNPESMKWSKLVVNLIGNASSAILNMRPGEIYANSKLFAIERQQLLEAFQVMRGNHIPVTDLPGTRVKLLKLAVTSLPVSISQLILKKVIGSGRGSKMPSFHIDLYNQHGHSEVDYLNGAVVRSGEKIGIKSPVNKLLTDILLKMTNNEMPLNAFDNNPGKFIKYLEEHHQL